MPGCGVDCEVLAQLAAAVIYLVWLVVSASVSRVAVAPVPNRCDGPCGRFSELAVQCPMSNDE